MINNASFILFAHCCYYYYAYFTLTISQIATKRYRQKSDTFRAQVLHTPYRRVKLTCLVQSLCFLFLIHFYSRWSLHLKSVLSVGKIVTETHTFLKVFGSTFLCGKYQLSIRCSQKYSKFSNSFVISKCYVSEKKDKTGSRVSTLVRPLSFMKISIASVTIK